MESCKGDKLTAYQQPSFMIDNLLTRKAIDHNGDYPAVPMAAGAVGRRRGSSDDGEVVNGSGRAAADMRESCISGPNTQESRSSCSKRESTSTSGGEEDDDGFRKRKKPRTAFSREQVGDLEKKFQEKKYLSSAERGELAERLKLSDMQVKTWFQNRRMKYKRQTEEAELEMKSPKYPTYPSFVPYGGFYSSYMPMAYKSDNLVHYPYPTLRSPPTPSGSSDSNFSPMSLTSPTHFSSLHSPLSRPAPTARTPSANPSTSYFPNTGVLTPLTSPSSSPYHHSHQHHHHTYFTTDTTTANHTPQSAAGVSIAAQNVAQHVQQLQFTATAEWPRPIP